MTTAADTPETGMGGPTLHSHETRPETPTMGRIVIYNHAPVTHGPPGEGRQTVEQSPALVQGVNANGTLRLHVFGPFAHFGRDGIQLVASSVFAPAQPPLVGTWHWPART